MTENSNIDMNQGIHSHWQSNWFGTYFLFSDKISRFFKTWQTMDAYVKCYDWDSSHFDKDNESYKFDEKCKLAKFYTYFFVHMCITVYKSESYVEKEKKFEFVFVSYGKKINKLCSQKLFSSSISYFCKTFMCITSTFFPTQFEYRTCSFSYVRNMINVHFSNANNIPSFSFGIWCALCTQTYRDIWMVWSIVVHLCIWLNSMRPDGTSHRFSDNATIPLY